MCHGVLMIRIIHGMELCVLLEEIANRATCAYLQIVQLVHIWYEPTHNSISAKHARSYPDICAIHARIFGAKHARIFGAPAWGGGCVAWYRCIHSYFGMLWLDHYTNMLWLDHYTSMLWLDHYTSMLWLDHYTSMLWLDHEIPRCVGQWSAFSG
jgi:hypothetical protein